jgi:cell division protein FtsI (penicillin-binding protein 3)
VAKDEPEKKRAKRKESVQAHAAEGPITVADAPTEDAGQVRVPSVEGLFARAAVRTLAGARLEAEIVGTGRVVSQRPPAGSVVDRGSRVAVVLQPL